MEQPLISVIIPVYNVEKYLHRCVDSVLNQTYKNLEIILVDDGSPDSCPTICDEYAQKDSRVIVIHQSNSGQSGARNSGLSRASGLFVGFLDSDDWIAQDTYEYLIGLSQAYDAEVVQIELQMVTSVDDELENRSENIVVYEGKDILQHYMTRTTSGKGYSMCCGIYAASTVKDLRFRVGKINEDIDFKYKALCKAHKMVESNVVKYYYFQDLNGHSTSRGGLKRKDFDLVDTSEEIIKLTKDEEYGNIRYLGEVRRARTSLSLLCKLAYFGISDDTLDKKEVVKHLTHDLRSNLKLLISAPLPLSRKILAVLFSINYKMTEAIVRLTSKIVS